MFKRDVNISILSEDINIVKAAGVKAIIHLSYGYKENENFLQCQKLRDEIPLFKITAQDKEEMSINDKLSGIRLLGGVFVEGQKSSDKLIGMQLLNNAFVDRQGGNDSLSEIRLSRNALKDGQGGNDKLSGIRLLNSTVVDTQGIIDRLTFKGVFDLTRSDVSTFA